MSKPNLAPNLGQRLDNLSGETKKGPLRWFSEARLGMFVHYGLYSIPGRGEWFMFNEKIPSGEYNRLAGKFRAGKFDADQLAGLARRAGAGYVVMGARHHEGFCLWDSQTTNFTTARTAARRDLIREHVEACRRAGLRVGIYYSLMSWQWPAIVTGPSGDPRGWEAMVAEAHAQVRELLENYGRVDVLWYDGCLAPGVSDRKTIARYWRSRELNAMVRRLQPGILINDRSCLPEDFSTPEQRLTLPPRGRPWECCMTIGEHWGWHRNDRHFKTPAELVRRLIVCARYDGNLLLNVGPDEEGRAPSALAQRLEAVGRWMEIHGEAVRGAQRTAYTEADHLLGMVTSQRRKLFFHVFKWPGSKACIAGVPARIASGRLLSTGKELPVEQFKDGTAMIRGLPVRSPDPVAAVIALEFNKKAPRGRPPALLVEKDTGLYDPAEAEIHPCHDSVKRSRHGIALNVSGAGQYQLQFSVIGRGPLRLSAVLDGKTLPAVLVLTCTDYPDTLQIGPLVLEQGRHHLVLHADQSLPFGLLAWRLQPIWQSLTSEHWLTIGPFPSPYRIPGTEREVRRAMQTIFPPEREFSRDGIYEGAGGHPVRWQVDGSGHAIVDFTQRDSNGENGVYYARTTLVAPERRRVEILLGCDWWANLFLNGKMVRTSRASQAVKKDGSWFSAWKPRPARLRLKKGKNIFLVKCHQGRAGNWFNFFLNDPGDIRIFRGP